MVIARRDHPRVVAHRGASAVCPENTAAAFNAALEAGADALEFDVQATVDGELVVVHDYELARTTDGDGLVHERSLDYVRSLSAGRWFAESFAGERVPLLSEVLALSADGFELQIKGLPSEALVDRVVRAIEEAGVADRVEVTGDHTHAVAEVKRRSPRVAAGLFSPKKESWMSARLYRQIVEHHATFGSFDVVHASLPELRILDVDRLHAAGLLVHAADINRPGELTEAARLGVDQLTTDDPAAALEVLDGRESRRCPCPPELAP